MEIWNRRNPVGGAPIVDSALDVNSEHCVQNKVVAEAISTINSTLDTLFKTKPYAVTTSQAGFVRTDLDGNYYIISAKTSNNNADDAIELSPVYNKANNLWFVKVRDTSGNVKGNANVSIEVCYIKLS